MHIIVLFGIGPWVLQHIIDLLGSGSYELIRRGRAIGAQILLLKSQVLHFLWVQALGHPS